MTSRPFRIAIGGDELVGVIHLPAGGPSPCVVACHGMGASKDGDKYLELGRELPAAGLALARFDFRGSGESGGSYADATVASRIADLEAVLDRELALIPGGDHRLTDPLHRRHALERSRRWLARHLDGAAGLAVKEPA